MFSIAGLCSSSNRFSLSKELSIEGAEELDKESEAGIHISSSISERSLSLEGAF